MIALTEFTNDLFRPRSLCGLVNFILAFKLAETTGFCVLVVGVAVVIEGSFLKTGFASLEVMAEVIVVVDRVVVVDAAAILMAP